MNNFKDTNFKFNSSTNGAMITVPPSGTPVVVPTGRIFSDGHVELLKGRQ